MLVRARELKLPPFALVGRLRTLLHTLSLTLTLNTEQYRTYSILLMTLLHPVAEKIFEKKHTFIACAAQGDKDPGHAHATAVNQQREFYEAPRILLYIR
jgi:hypothetical protein